MLVLKTFSRVEIKLDQFYISRTNVKILEYKLKIYTIVENFWLKKMFV